MKGTVKAIKVRIKSNQTCDTRIQIRTIEVPRARQGPGEWDSMNAAFMSQKHEDPGRGKATQALPSTDVARQHDTSGP